MNISRRDAMKRGGTAVVVAAAAVTAGVSAKAAQPDPLCEGVQPNTIRHTAIVGLGIPPIIIRGTEIEKRAAGK